MILRVAFKYPDHPTCLPITVHEDSGNLQEDLHARTLSRQFKQLKRSGHVETDRDIETGREVNVGRAVDDDVEVLGDFRAQLFR